MKRLALAAMAWLAIAAPAAALERAALFGEWETQHSDGAGKPADGEGRLRIFADESSDGLDGYSPASGWDGVLNGRVAPGPNGSLIWSGRWASIWPEGATMGTFRFVFTDANTFTGTWSSDDGEIQGATWNGARAH